MTTFELISKACDEWLFSPSERKFVDIVSSAIALNPTLKRDLAVRYKTSESTIERWAKGSTAPHPLIQSRLIRDLMAYSKNLSW